MKSQSDNLFHIVVGICKDVQQAYPNLKGLDLDLERLAHNVSNRGLGVFTLDLPALESLLLQGLETGLLDSKGTKRYSKEFPVPRLFAGLWMRIFDRGLRLRSDADVNAITFLRQLLVIGKKLEVPCSPRRIAQAIKDYIDVERQLVNPTLAWRDDSLDCSGARFRVHFCDNLGLDLPLYPELTARRTSGEQRLLARLQRSADYVAGLFGTYCPDCFIAEREAGGRRLGLRHGPGAVAERGGRFFDKMRFTNWSAKLESYYPFNLYGKMPNDERDKPRNHEVPSRLICVPKTAKGPRIIAAEPSEHMFTQNLLADWLVDNINEHLGSFINLRDQKASQKLVLSSSLSQELATIDLSSASDRLSLWVVERIFRTNPSILKAIHSTRTRWINVPNHGPLIMKKFASQGTALTFPVQTLVFFIIALASCLGENEEPEHALRRLRGKVRVYGDDIIVPTHRYVETVELLTALQLKVNKDKSFVQGHFRESCGVDAFKGYDITPIKPKATISDSPASCQAVIDTLNNLFYKGYWNAQLHLWNRQRPDSFKGIGVVGLDAGATGFGSFSFDTMLKRLDPDERRNENCRTQERTTGKLPILGTISDYGSIARQSVPGFLRDLGFRVRWNLSLHRHEVRYASFRSISSVRPFDCGYSGLLQRQLSPLDPNVLSTVGIQGVPERPMTRKRHGWVALTDLFGKESKE